MRTTAGRILTEFENFEKLTSVHINSTDDQLLASGYTFGVKLFDLGTGQVRRLYTCLVDKRDVRHSLRR